MLDGELVAFADGQPDFPRLCERMLHHEEKIPVTFVVFDVLAADGESTARLPHSERRALLESLSLNGAARIRRRCSMTARRGSNW